MSVHEPTLEFEHLAPSVETNQPTEVLEDRPDPLHDERPGFDSFVPGIRHPGDSGDVAVLQGEAAIDEVAPAWSLTESEADETALSVDVGLGSLLGKALSAEASPEGELVASRGVLMPEESETLSTFVFQAVRLEYFLINDRLYAGQLAPVALDQLVALTLVAKPEQLQQFIEERRLESPSYLDPASADVVEIIAALKQDRHHEQKEEQVDGVLITIHTLDPDGVRVTMESYPLISLPLPESSDGDDERAPAEIFEPRELDVPVEHFVEPAQFHAPAALAGLLNHLFVPTPTEDELAPIVQSVPGNAEVVSAAVGHYLPVPFEVTSRSEAAVEEILLEPSETAILTATPHHPVHVAEDTPDVPSSLPSLFLDHDDVPTGPVRSPNPAPFPVPVTKPIESPIEQPLLGRTVTLERPTVAATRLRPVEPRTSTPPRPPDEVPAHAVPDTPRAHARSRRVDPPRPSQRPPLRRPEVTRTKRAHGHAETHTGETQRMAQRTVLTRSMVPAQRHTVRERVQTQAVTVSVQQPHIRVVEAGSVVREQSQTPARVAVRTTAQPVRRERQPATTTRRQQGTRGTEIQARPAARVRALRPAVRRQRTDRAHMAATRPTTQQETACTVIQDVISRWAVGQSALQWTTPLLPMVTGDAEIAPRQIRRVRAFTRAAISLGLPFEMTISGATLMVRPGGTDAVLRARAARALSALTKGEKRIPFLIPLK